MKVSPLATLLCLALLFSGQAGTTRAQDNERREEVLVIGTPLSADLQSQDVPYAVQSFELDTHVTARPLSIADFLNRAGASVTVNDVQNNPLQPDLQFRGFTASPLLGTPQGISVYQNGVRMNGNFGHEVNWDLIPESAVRRVSVVAGSNPLYGLNTLGGAVVMTTKTGFEDPGIEATARYGSFDRLQLQASAGGNAGPWGYFVAVERFEEDGWRDFSDSAATNAYGALSWKSEATRIDAYFNGGDSTLRGNGAIPEELMAVDRDAVFTHPDITENRMVMATLAARHQVRDGLAFNLRIFLRDVRTDSFNGDGAEAEDCDPPNQAFLCEEEEPDEPLQNQLGNPVMAGFDAVNNRSRRDQTDWGITFETDIEGAFAGLDHHFVLGADYMRGTTGFASTVEFAVLLPDRSTSGSDLFDGDGFTEMRARTNAFSVYAGDTIRLAEALTATISARFSRVEIDNRDRSGDRPELTAAHDYDRLNMGFGLAYRLGSDVSVYGGAYQSSRAPTPVELACSHADAPCTLPNSFIADPPLEDVVSRGVEAGVRGQSGAIEKWHAGAFYIVNRDDIIFQTTGGVTASEGFFSNVDKTRRWGIEITAEGQWQRIRWFTNYTYLHATFRDTFVVSSPHHPTAEDGMLAVEPGDRIPGLPAHQGRLGLVVSLSKRLEAGIDMRARGGQHLRGDEGNLVPKTDGYVLFGAQARFALTDNVAVTVDVENILNAKYETFGTFGEPEEVLGTAFGDSPLFLAPGSARGVWVGLSISW